MENKTNCNCKMQLLSLPSLIFATLIFLIWLKLIKTNRKTTPPLPPGPKARPVIGSLPEMIQNRPAFRWIHKLMQEFDTEIACIRLGQTLIIPVTSLELAREFLKEQDSIFASRPDCMSARLTSTNYLTTALSPFGDQWRKMRRIVTSEIVSPAMHRFLHVKRREEADHLVKYVYNQCRTDNHGPGPGPGTRPVNVRVAARHYCGNVMRKLFFGKRFFGPGLEDGGPGFEEREHVDGLFTILSNLYGFGIGDYAPWLEVFDFDGCKRVISDAINNVRKYHDHEIEKRMDMWKQGIKESEDDILDVLINLKDSKNNPLLTIEEIKAQVLEIMIASVDNPSNAAEWAIAEMINQPHILNKATKELDRVVGRDRLVQESDIPKLNYIKACIKESFRLHPIGPFNVPHVSTKDTTVGGYFIPKGSRVLVSRLGLGQNPRVWKDAFKYKPERHINVDEDKEVVLVDHDLRVFSFGVGRRGCPGVMLGSTMATILLARLIQGFNWTAPLNGLKVDLAESKYELSMAKPLIARAIPRLEPHVYLQQP